MSDFRLSNIVADSRRTAVRAITQRVSELCGVNLGQGSNFLPTPRFLTDAATQAIEAGHNAYSEQEGIRSLREAIAQIVRIQSGVAIDSARGVLVSAGATAAFFSAVVSLVERGEDVVLLEPYYPYHLAALRLAGATPQFVRHGPPEWHLDPPALDAAISSKTRVVVLTNPCNPTGRVYTQRELSAVLDVCRRRGVAVVCDEVYGDLTYDDHQHFSVAGLAGSQQVAVIVSSFSKTYAITGWRIGYALGPPQIIAAMTMVHDALYVCAPHPLQHAVASALVRYAEHRQHIRSDFSKRRAIILRILSRAGFDPLVPEGTFYVLAGYERRYGQMSSSDACARLLEENHVASVPASTFYHDGFDPRLLRFCFAVPDEDLERLSKLLG